jgi:zinc protease
MNFLKSFLSLAAFLILCFNTFAQNVENIDIPYEKFVLKNGLTLIVHEDHKAPIVAVNVWYHVGSKNEKPGKTGFAHLFEHLMFNGSEHFDDDYFQALERIGATDRNGTTNVDRTNYFQNVPTSALDVVLWLESDRMGHLLGAVTQEKLDEQRGVVQNEKRQGENQPYGLTRELLTVNTYPKGHPYSWTTIGSMEDLDAASLDDVHEWFKEYYGAANAILVIAGDVKAEEVKEKVEKYFGDIPPGPPVTKHEVWIAPIEETKRQVAQDRVPQARIYKVWNIPEWGSEELAYLDLVTDVFAMGKTSRLYKRLVYDEQIATNVWSYYSGGEIGSQIFIVATAKPGEDLSEIEKLIDEEVEKFLKEGPSQEELDRVRTQHIARFIRGIERIGGFGGKSDILAESEVYGGSPDYYKKRLQFVADATTDNLKDVANKWLTKGAYILEVHPYPEYATTGSDVDRSKLPEAETPPDAKFPDFETATLSNGLKIVLANRKSVPVVNFNLLVNAGYASDQFSLPGTASLSMAMMDEGTEEMSALEISDELAKLGANLGTGSGLDMCNVSLSALKANLDKSLDIYADVILNPSFPQNELDRLKQQRLAQIQREKVTPFQMGLRVFPVYLYGNDHAYGTPFTGSGYEDNVKQMSRDDLSNFHQTWFKPNNSTLIVVGDITMNEIKTKLENLFSNWEGGDVPVKNISEVVNKEGKTVYLLDRPGSQQSIIFAGHLVPPRAETNDVAVETMNDILGGTFTSRINMNLREDKHWSYGSRSLILGAKKQRPFLAYALVQTDKTKESIVEVKKEISEYLTTRPATEEELTKVKLNNTLSLAGTWETMGAVGGSLSEMIIYDLPQDYFETYSSRIKNLSLDQIHTTANNFLKPDNLVWVVVGDREKIEDGIRELGYDIILLDGDGKLVDQVGMN